MADPATDVPSFDDYSGAFDRVRRAMDAGQEPSAGDIDIFRRGDATHGTAYDAAQAQPSPSPAAPPPQPQDQTLLQRGEALIGQGDPNSYLNMGLRLGTHVAGILADLPANAYNAAKADYERRGGTNWAGPPIELRPDATPAEREWAAGVKASPMVAPGGRVQTPSGVLRSVTGIPEMGANASMPQQIGEAIGPALVGSAPSIVGAWNAAENIPGAVSAALGSGAKNFVLPTGGSLVAQEATRRAGGGEMAQLLAGLAGGAAPGLSTPTLARGYGAMQKRFFGAPEGDPNIPSGPEVGAATDQINQTLAKYMQGDAAKPITETYSMLAGVGGKATQQSLSRAGALPAYVAEEAPLEILPKVRDLALVQRRELPDVTPENAPVVQLAQDARDRAAAAGVKPGDVHDQSTLNAMQDWIKSNMGGKDVDVTDTYNMMKGLAAAPGGAPATAPTGGVLGHQSVRDAMGQQAEALRDITNTITDPTTGQQRLVTKFEPLRQWLGEIGTETQRPMGTKLALKGPQEGQVYGAVKQNIADAASKQGVNPEALQTAMEIEHRELAARDLAKVIPAGRGAFKDVAGVMDMMSLKDPGKYARIAGGEYDPTGAPAPTPGSGDIRQTLANLATLGKSTQMPPRSEGLTGWWREGREGGPGIGSFVAALAGGTPFLPFGPLAGPMAAYGLNWARAAAQQNPTVRSVMRGTPAPWFAPSGSPLPGIAVSNQAPNIRRALGGDTNPSEQQIQTPTSPYSPPQPGVVPKRPLSPYSQLPTTQGILAAWNRANVGNPRSMTAP